LGIDIDWTAIGYWTALVLGVLLLLAVNAVGAFMVALQLPGTWVILLATVLAGWLTGPIGWPTSLPRLVLGVLGELIESVGGAAGANIAGAGRKATWLALAGSIAGAIAGTFVIPVPIIGTLTGAAIGAASGSILGDRWDGRHW